MSFRPIPRLTAEEFATVRVIQEATTPAVSAGLEPVFSRTYRRRYPAAETIAEAFARVADTVVAGVHSSRVAETRP